MLMEQPAFLLRSFVGVSIVSLNTDVFVLLRHVVFVLVR